MTYTIPRRKTNQRRTRVGPKTIPHSSAPPSPHAGRRARTLPYSTAQSGCSRMLSPEHRGRIENPEIIAHPDNKPSTPRARGAARWGILVTNKRLKPSCSFRLVGDTHSTSRLSHKAARPLCGHHPTLTRTTEQSARRPAPSRSRVPAGAA